MEELFDGFSVEDGCNCRICKRGRYEKDLKSRIAQSLPLKLQNELAKYLEWYYESLAHAETEIEYRNYKENESKAA